MFLKKVSILFCVMCLVFSCKDNNPTGTNNDGHDGDGNGNDNESNITVTDIDGNVYSTVKIGKKIWTREDLRTTRFNDGTKIPLVESNEEWRNLTTGAFCYYKNDTDPDTIKKYGALYNYYALNRLAPRGWHVPSIAEWEEMIKYLIDHGYNWDGSLTGNKVAKSLAADNSWKSSLVPGSIGYNLDENNKSNFSALPSGCRFQTGVFGYRGVENHWWSSTSTTYAGQAYSIYLLKDSVKVKTCTHYRDEGFSVRLVKD